MAMLDRNCATDKPMARPPRLDLPEVAQHVVQRGNDRRPCFFTTSDYQCYLSELHEIAQRMDCAIHAYVLMTNHVHLLMTPPAKGIISRVMQCLGRRYVRYVNDRYRRTGTLWEGRYKSCLVDNEDYLLRCYRYIELNPVRAHMVSDALDHRWSSHACNVGLAYDPLLRPHASYMALGATASERHSTYRKMLLERLAPEDLHAIRQHLQRQHAYGSKRFRQIIESRLERRAGPAKMGRPRKPDHQPKSALRP